MKYSLVSDSWGREEKNAIKTVIKSNIYTYKGKYVKGHIYTWDKQEKLYSYFVGNRDNIKKFVVPYKGMKINFNLITDWKTIISLLVQDGNNVKIICSINIRTY